MDAADNAFAADNLLYMIQGSIIIARDAAC